MKIAIITSAFFESTFPLIRELQKNIKVNCYAILSNSFLNPPNFDISENYNGETGIINKETKENLIPNEIKSYFNKDLDFLKLTITAKSKKKLLRQIGREISNSNYDVIHLIGTNHYFIHLAPYFKNRNIIFSLHEVETGRGLPKLVSLKIIRKQFLYNRIEKLIYSRPKTRYIVFSKNEHEKLLHKKNILAKNCSIIQFGLFNVFNEYQGIPALDIPRKPYFLFFGLMKKYKGIDLFFDVAKKMEKQNVNFVAAGKDVEGFLRGQKNIPSNLMVINKYLSDAEVSFLVRSSYAVIMPYRSASQSGIPPTAFSFNKPIIASNVSGVNEYLTNGYNSLIFKNYTSEDLIRSINAIKEQKLYSKLEKNICLNPFGNDESIESIAFKTVEEYKKML